MCTACAGFTVSDQGTGSCVTHSTCTVKYGRFTDSSGCPRRPGVLPGREVWQPALPNAWLATACGTPTCACACVFVLLGCTTDGSRVLCCVSLAVGVILAPCGLIGGAARGSTEILHLPDFVVGAEASKRSRMAWPPPGLPSVHVSASMCVAAWAHPKNGCRRVAVQYFTLGGVLAQSCSHCEGIQG